MDPRKSCPCKPEQPDCHQGRTDNDRRQSKLGFALLFNARDSGVPLNELHSYFDPHAAHHSPGEHAQEQAKECETRLPQVEPIYALEYEWESAKEQVENSEEDSGVQIQDQSHGLKGEDLEWPQKGVANGAEDGSVGFLDGRFPPLVACLFADTLCLLLEDDGVLVSTVSFFSLDATNNEIDVR